MRKCLCLVVFMVFSLSVWAYAQGDKSFEIKLTAKDSRTAVNQAEQKALWQAISELISAKEIKQYEVSIKKSIFDKSQDFATEVNIIKQAKAKAGTNFTIEVVVDMEVLKMGLDKIKPGLGGSKTPKSGDLASLKGIKELKAEAESGEAKAQYALGLAYYNGKGLAKDYRQAFQWFQKAAQQGFPEAQFSLGLLYENGTGVTQDYKKAFEWYQKAAAQGLAAAQFSLGFMYTEGHSVAQDHKKAFEWFQKAANQGLPDAQYVLGVLYEHGRGVAKNKKLSDRWYQKAQQSGYRQP